MYLNGTPRARRVFHADALGSIAALTAPDAAPVQTYAYSAFGTIRSQTGPDPNRVAYTARDLLGGSQGWMYYRFRIYAPELGRFTAEDLLKFVDGPNRYIYVMNSPVFHFDPRGFVTCQTGLTGNIGAGTGFGGSAGIAISLSWNDGFQWGGYGSLESGGHFGYSAGGGVEVQMSANRSISGLAGTTLMVGGGAGILGGNIQQAIDGSGTSPIGSVSVGVGTAPEVHSYVSKTWVWSWSFKNLLTGVKAWVCGRIGQDWPCN